MKRRIGSEGHGLLTLIRRECVCAMSCARCEFAYEGMAGRTESASELRAQRVLRDVPGELPLA